MQLSLLARMEAALHAGQLELSHVRDAVVEVSEMLHAKTQILSNTGALDTELHHLGVIAGTITALAAKPSVPTAVAAVEAIDPAADPAIAVGEKTAEQAATVIQEAAPVVAILVPGAVPVAAEVEKVATEVAAAAEPLANEPAPAPAAAPGEVAN